MKSKSEVLKELQQIPGVGPSIALDLWNLDIRTIADLAKKDPEKMYRDLCRIQNTHLDRCLLYVFRCAVYYASEKHHDPKLLKWWN